MMRVFSLTLFAAILASCSPSTQTSPPFQSRSNADATRSKSSDFNSLYVFNGAPDGADPSASLLSFNGTFYGTTAQGGSGPCSRGCGTVFAVDASGTEKVLYSFQSGTDGAEPQAALIAVGSKLYGTTTLGGSGPSGGNGTVFEISTSGKERVLHRFKGAPDGARPYSTLLSYDGALYGTTYSGGTSFHGVVFRVDLLGRERIVYRFQNGSDGSGPLAGLTAVKGEFYGTTAGGGNHSSGTVFQVDPAGAERVLYAFAGHRDGETPSASLLFNHRELYGSTVFGGGPSSLSYGTVFKVDLSGHERVLHRFTGNPDGSSPSGTLIAFKGELYGTTYWGGESGSGRGYGTIFKITPAGNEAVLHDFVGGNSGGNPAAGLILAHRALYGTSSDAGLSAPSGNGTIFTVTE